MKLTSDMRTEQIRGTVQDMNLIKFIHFNLMMYKGKTARQKNKTIRIYVTLHLHLAER